MPYSIEQVVWGVVALYIAAVGLRHTLRGGHTLAGWRSTGATDPVDVRALSSASEPIELGGTARKPPDGDVLTAPYTGRACLLAEWRCQESHKTGDDHEWVTRDAGRTDQQLVVNDGTGRVSVDPEDATLDLGRWEWITDDGDDDQPPEDGTVTDSLRTKYLSGKRRYQERLLEPGATVYVSGAAVTDQSTDWNAGYDVAVAASSEADAYRIGDDTDRNGTRRELASGIANVVAGIAAVAIGLSLGLLSFGLPLLG